MCAGQLASAVGKENFPMQVLEQFTAFGLECFAENSKYELRETALSYFSDLSKIMRAEIAPIFDKILEEVIKSCNSDSGIKKNLVEKEKEGFSLDSDSDFEDEIEGVDVDINFLDEKSAAISAMGNLALNCPGLMLPKLKEVLETLDQMKDYFHENIRYHTCLTLTQIAFGLLRHHTNNYDKFDWKKGLPAQTALPNDVKQFLDTHVFPHFYKVFDDEQNKEVIEKVLENIREIAEELGPAGVDTQMESLTKYMILLLKKEAFCNIKNR
jgi:hypothetical protein